MKPLLTGVLALSLLHSAVAVAQPRYPDNAQGRNEQGGPGAIRGPQGNPGQGQNNARWSRGDRVPDQYRQNQYSVSDWRQRGLKAPPRGYYWVRDDSNNFFLAARATGLIAQTVYQDDRQQSWNQRYQRSYTYNDDSYYQECRNKPDPAGVLVGALIGGLLGNAAGSGGGRTGATAAGVIIGGAIGADRSYAYKTYYDGFNAGRPNTSYDWRNPGNDHRGTFRVGAYSNDPGGFRCADFTQTIFIQGRPQAASGRACRQPDGTWAVVR